MARKVGRATLYTLDEVIDLSFTPEEKADFERRLPKMMEKLELEYLREIGRDLKKARCKAKLTQADVARSVHTKKSVISRVETGAQNVSVGYLVKIANALGKSVNIQLCDHH